MSPSHIQDTGAHLPEDGWITFGPAERRLLERAFKVLARACVAGPAISDPSLSGSLFATRLGGREHEVFAAAFLNARHQLIAFEDLFRGTVDGAEVHPRVVAQRALSLNACAVIVGHNHPSGNPEPSAADRAVTARLKQALALLDIRLLDHIIVAGNSHRSMASLGLI